MKVLYSVNIPAAVAVDNRVYGASLRKDILVDGEVLVVFPMKNTQTLGRPSVAVRVQDSYTGEILTVQAFNEIAKQLSKVQVGDVINAYGKMGQFRGRQFFTMTEFKDNVTFYSSLREARDVLGDQVAAENESPAVGPQSVPELEEVAEIA